ncbi:MAG: hypothetical protein KDA71_05575, partial [Planctomycetales bacterium]|nr:hypothetical protein [Planctomycetales bacterium]
MMLLRKMLVPLLVALAVIVTAAGCETDEDSPFDKEGVEIDWPTLDPSRYHWNGVTSPYFEFWAWHIIADDETNFTITLGISNPG